MTRSIATKISFAALSLTMAVAVALGTASYLFSRHTLKSQIQDGLSFKTSIIGGQLEAALKHVNDDMQNMAGNLLLVNALLDSTGRDAYVGPFLRSYKLPHQISWLLTLSDFAGKPLLSSQGEKKVRFYNDEALLIQVISKQQALARIETVDKEKILLIAYPVLYAATGLAEGMLVIEIPLIPFVAACLPEVIKNKEMLCTLSAGTSELCTTIKNRSVVLLSSTASLALPFPLEHLELSLAVGQDATQAYSSLSNLAAIYLFVGAFVLLLVVIQSQMMGRRLSAPLIALTRTAGRIARAGVPDSDEIVTSCDEISQLTTAFNTMLTHLQEAHFSLEVKVEERTAQLADTMKVLDTILDNSPIGILKIIDRKPVWMNRKTEDITLYSKEDTVFQTTRILFPSDEAFENFGQKAELILSTGAVFESEQQLIRKDGVQILIRHIGKALVPDDLNQGIIWLIEDVTERKWAEQELKASEEKFRTIANYTYAWELWENAEGEYLYCSPSCERFTGYSAGSFMEDHTLLERLIHPDELEIWKAHHREVHGGGGRSHIANGSAVKEVDFRILHGNGEVRWISHTCYPIHDGDGRSLGLRISNRDITDRKVIEEALRRSEETLNRAQSVAEIGSWHLDIATNRVEWSEETYRLFGVSPQHGINIKTLMSIIHPDDREMFLAAWKSALDGAFYDVTHRIVVAGNILWVRERAEIERDREGRPLSGIGTVQNVTDRKQSEDQIIKLAQELQTILATLSVGVSFIKNRRFQWANAAHERIFGYAQGECVGLETSEFFADEEGYARVGAGYAQLANGASYNTEVKLKMKDGRHFWSSLSGRAVQPNNPDAGSIWMFQDITERKSADDKLQAFAEMQSVLLQEVNHRVKNNLVAIISMLHKEEDLALDKGMPEYHARIKELVWRISGLLTVHRLLSSSEWKPLPLTRLCESVIQGTLKGLTAIRSIHLDISPSAIEVDSDQAHALAMVLNELSTNVIKYAMGERDAVHITITIQQVENDIELWFQDDGPGFPEALLQEEVPRRSSSIGMSLLQGLVTRNLRGSLCLMNNNGALARITFPIMNHEEVIEMKENQSCVS